MFFVGWFTVVEVVVRLAFRLVSFVLVAGVVFGWFGV